MIVPTALIFSLASLISAARIDTKPIEARDANRLVRRHTGPYTWCGIQIAYNTDVTLALQWPLRWDKDKHSYEIINEGAVTWSHYDPPGLKNGHIVNANLEIAGELETKNTFDIYLQLVVAPDGDIQGVGLVRASYNGVRSPQLHPGYGFQCSDDPTQTNKVTIPSY
ncbi:uncharacterized protein L969DRAFT_17836 [Mixia osmundae IAM 14324]|uniref:Uncharacterized protein n=1 Tax=Mixia osmundae (strain CBS 9802 / IAM 14324 / JCM 22182 / KY 12970) TaxID=764103 RepID=G7E186_MIXOS|nr:uncharacterized protein L969DRAFT_17836 [Mixia osmundae IAM 14324]KEI38765.1 hypothetical protein L969DRAFT_17836 [Mixia osmundae IAM 14324]GAA96596.1 hypothetical protein E5Q_03266 [Mixia osmundae IAM 14324]